MYRFSYDEQRNFLTIILEGYWTIETYRAYEADLLAMHRRISMRHKDYRVLSDGTKFEVQSAEIRKSFDQLGEKEYLNTNHGRVAIIVSTVLNKMQARRSASISNLRFFSNCEDAMAWLFEDSD